MAKTPAENDPRVRLFLFAMVATLCPLPLLLVEQLELIHPILRYWGKFGGMIWVSIYSGLLIFTQRFSSRFEGAQPNVGIDNNPSSNFVLMNYIRCRLSRVKVTLSQLYEAKRLHPSLLGKIVLLFIYLNLLGREVSIIDLCNKITCKDDILNLEKEAKDSQIIG